MYVVIGPYEHIAFINTKMDINGAYNSLKCKLISNTFRDITLRRYMGLPRLSITNYWDLEKKLVHRLILSRHKEMSTTSLFNIFPGTFESLRKYLSHFNEEKISQLEKCL